MAYNNTVVLVGNLGSDAIILKTEEENVFAKLSIATTDSYKDAEGNWQKKDAIWHTVMVFKPALVLKAQSYTKGQRLKVTGSISYRDFEVTGDDGKVFTKREASIIAGAIEKAELEKKINQNAA